jgi:O-antigen/teichoic acid export membrane protein
VISEIKSNFKYKIVINTISFVSSIFITRLLGVEGRGALSSLSILLLSLVTISNFGSGNAIVFLINRHLPSREILMGVVNRLICWTVMIAFLLLSVLFKLNVLEVFHFFDLKTLILIFILVIIEVSLFYYNKILIGKANFAISNSLSILMQVLNVICLFILINFLVDKLMVVVLSLFISKLISLFLLLHSEKIKVKLHRRESENIKIVRQFGWKTYLSDLASLLQSRFDQMALVILLPLDQLGTYVIMVYLAEIVYLIPDSIGPSLLNLNYKDGSNDRKLDQTLISMRLGMFFSLVLSLVVYYVSIFVFLPFGYGLPSRLSDEVLQVLLVGTFFYGYAKYISKYFNGLKEMVLFSSYIMMVGTIVNIVLIIIALTSFGSIFSVAWATTLSNIVVSTVFLVKFIRISKLNFIDALLVKKSDLTRLFYLKMV